MKAVCLILKSFLLKTRFSKWSMGCDDCSIYFCKSNSRSVPFWLEYLNWLESWRSSHIPVWAEPRMYFWNVWFAFKYSVEVGVCWLKSWNGANILEWQFNCVIGSLAWRAVISWMSYCGVPNPVQDAVTGGRGWELTVREKPKVAIHFWYSSIHFDVVKMILSW